LIDLTVSKHGNQKMLCIVSLSALFVCCCGRSLSSPIRLALPEKFWRAEEWCRSAKREVIVRWLVSVLCVFGKSSAVCYVKEDTDWLGGFEAWETRLHVKEEATGLDLDSFGMDGRDFTLWVCLYSCCCGRPPPPIRRPRKRAEEEYGVESRNWRKCHRGLACYNCVFGLEDLLHLISCKGRGRGRTIALAGGFRSIYEAKDGSERWESFCEFVLLFVVVEDAFRPPASVCLRNGSG